jgi:hypothetical protein
MTFNKYSEQPCSENNSGKISKNRVKHQSNKIHLCL